METNDKARFFAQYWGQKVLYSALYGGIVAVQSYYLHKDNIHGRDYILLKPLSLISDEDAEAIGFSSGESARTTFLKSLGALRIEADYLRSKGYALPYLNYSVEDLIQMNWIKLKED